MDSKPSSQMMSKNPLSQLLQQVAKVQLPRVDSVKEQSDSDSTSHSDSGSAFSSDLSKNFFILLSLCIGVSLLPLNKLLTSKLKYLKMIQWIKAFFNPVEDDET